MTNIEKLELLGRAIWTKKEFGEYCGWSKSQVSILSKRMENLPLFHHKVFRDEALKTINSNVNKETQILKKIINKGKEIYE